MDLLNGCINIYVQVSECVKVPQFQITFPYGCIVCGAALNCLLMEMVGFLFLWKQRGWLEEARKPNSQNICNSMTYIKEPCFHFLSVGTHDN